MSDYYLIEINCEFDLDASPELIKNLQASNAEESKPLGHFPGWSVSRIGLVEKWENYKRYTFSIRTSVHEDVFIDSWDEGWGGFLRGLATHSCTQGFVGIIHCNTDFYPTLIYFVDKQPVIWHINVGNQKNSKYPNSLPAVLSKGAPLFPEFELENG